MTAPDSLLFLPHRLPYPPNKGDKLRSYHLLKYLAERYRVFVGTFIDDPQDEGYVEEVRRYCAGLHVARIEPRLARLASLTGLLAGEPLTLSYYRNAELARWVKKTVADEGIRTIVVFCSAMAQYVMDMPGPRLLVDFVDLDSAKWTEYARHRGWPMSWLYRREGEKLLAFEQKVAGRAFASFFVTDAEVVLFRKLAPECKARVEALEMGVDSEYFSPEHGFASPFGPEEVPLVFTGVMDYWPNVDAVVWFANEILPVLRAGNPAIRFYIVGMRPSPAVRALAGEGVVVTGLVPDVRPYLLGARVVVAPLRVARGIQTKVLEAMSMARPVVVAEGCAAAIDAEAGKHFATASDVPSFLSRVEELLNNTEAAAAMGREARRRVITRYSWQANLSRLGGYLDAGQMLACPENDVQA
ncbi:MAG: TIGR03087 family PEP-CTERM/XrtA system glycosyltransferase [Rhodocyclaceae bacterium]|nr:TIGR03087 family PEP-CTERM/XrtA system glycosyltransferase [Rhodocyclaceae bacterium]